MTRTQSFDGVGRNDPCPCGSGRKFKFCHGRRTSEQKCRVLYVHPAKQGVDPGDEWDLAGNPYLTLPVGVVGLINLLRTQGVTVRGLNYPLELTLDPRFSLRDWLYLHEGVQLILIDLHWYEHSYGAIQTARVCRQCHPQAWTVLGGLTASAFAEEIVRSFESVDFVIRGDAELPLLDLVQALGPAPRDDRSDFADIPNLTYRGHDGVVSNPLAYCARARHLDGLNFVDLEFLEHHDEYASHQFSGFLPAKGHWLCIGRGCRHNCSFCGGGHASHQQLARRDGLVLRSVEHVLHDVQRLRESGIQQVAFSLDLSDLPRDYWEALFRGLRERGIEIGVYNEFFRLPGDDFVEELVRTMDIHYSRLAFSPLSGNEAVRRFNGKPYSNEDLVGVLRRLGEHNVLVMLYFSLNLPGEDEAAFQQTLDLANAAYEVYPSGALDILNMCHTLDPVSPMSTSPDLYGIELSMRTFRDYYDYCFQTRLRAPGARSGASRGFRLAPSICRSLKAMADRWDAAAQGRESAWHAIPRTW